ncbi:uncharacterized protein LOC142358757 isoform X4 [Convolutriloba macropyga]|uniref:uncharacterized protein LOC142358757 isoform X4 n=1 Tax=Convolutriloba macropyga TaxID=536237 RepID=UPI003F5280D5
MKSANKIINKPVEQWSVKEMNDFLCRLGMINLTHLDYDEKVKIVKVLQRDEIVLQTESERVLKLKYEVQDLKRRSAKKPGLNDKMCARCQAELGMFMNSGAECFKCHFIVCKNCRVIVTEDGKTWLCILCAKQAKLRTISGEWFYEKVSERLKPSMASYVHGSNFVRDSIRLKNRGGLMGRGSLGGVGRAGFISNSSSNSPVMSKRGSALEGGPMGREASVISAWQAAFPGLTSKSRTLSASGITSREITNAALDSSLIGAGAVGGGGENGATDFEDSASSGDHCFKDFASSKLSAEIQKGLQDNYEHEQPNRRSSLQGGTSEDSSTTNTTGANIQPAGSNSSLHTTGLELGAMPRSSGGYSCSVPATPEHRRYLPPGTDWASLSYAGHPGMPAHPAEFAMMRGRSRGVPYGYHPRNPRHPGPPTQGRMPFRHPSQYRSMPAHAAYGYYPRGRPRHMAPMYASSRYSSQEDFRGSSRSIAMYPGEYPPPTMDSNDPRLPVRRRIRGSRESLDGQSRESRGLSKSYPSENRSSSMPPAEDRLGDEDEAVLNRLADPALNSSHNVPSLINSLTSTGATLGSTITTTATVASAASKEPVGSRDRLSQHHKQHNNNNHQSITTAPSPPTFPQNQPTPSQQSLSSSPSSNTNTTHSEANRATVQTKGKKKDKGGGEDFAMDKENGEAASVYFQRARSVMDLSGSVQTSRKSKGKRRGVTAMLLSSFKTSSSKLDVSATEKESGLDPSSAQSVGNNSSLLNKSFSSSSQTINLEPSFESSGDRKHGGSFFGSLKWRSMRSLSGSQTSLASKDSLKDQLRKNSKRFGSQFSRKLSGRSGKGDEHSKDDTLSVGSGGQAAGSNSYSNSKQVKSTSSSSDQQVVALDADGAQKQVKGAPKSGRVNAKKLILGCVQFTCKYNKDKKMLEVGRLSCASLNSSGNKLCSAYVKLTLTQSNGKVSKMKTKPAKPSADPEYDELLQLAVEEKEVKKSSLLISVCNKVSSTLGKDALLGEVEVSLAKMKDLQSQSLQQFPLTIYAANESKDIGSMKLTVKFEPRKGLSIRVSATGLNKKASTEPNTFCKLHLLPMSKAFKSEEIVKKSANPVYLQTFFIPLNSVSLLDFCLEIGVFSVSGGSTAGTTSLKTFLGGVRLSDGTATCRGSLVEWMQSTSDEIDLWNRVQSSLGEWVQGHLRLRANFTPFK